MVPEQMCAAQDETSEEQSSGRKLVTGTRPGTETQRAARGGEQPRGRRSRLASWEMRAWFLGAYLTQRFLP